MAHKIERFVLPLRAASAMAQYVPVTFQSPSAQSEMVIRAGSLNDDLIGMTIATVATAGDVVGVQLAPGVAKGVAGASLGAGVRVGVGCVNGILIPQLASNIASSAAGTGQRFVVGRALKNAVAGDIFPVLLQPEQLI